MSPHIYLVSFYAVTLLIKVGCLAAKAQRTFGPLIDPRALHGLHLGHAVHELAPVIHDNLHTSLLQHFSHLFLLDGTAVAAHIANSRDTSPHGTQGTALAVLDRDTFSRLLANDLTSVQIDGGIWLGGWDGKTGCSAEDMVRREELFLTHFLHTCLHSAESARADDSHAVLLALIQLLQDWHDTDTWLGFRQQGLDDLAQFAVDVGIDFFIGKLEAVLLLKAGNHAAEVLADEGAHEAGTGVAIRDVVLLEHFICEFGTCFEGELFGEYEGVVAVEQKLGNLEMVN